MVKKSISQIAVVILLITACNDYNNLHDTIINEMPSSFRGGTFRVANPQFLYRTDIDKFFLDLDGSWIPINRYSTGTLRLIAPIRSSVLLDSDDSLLFVMNIKDSVSFHYVYDWEMPRGEVPYLFDDYYICSDGFYDSDLEVEISLPYSIAVNFAPKTNDKAWRRYLKRNTYFSNAYNYYHSIKNRIKLVSYCLFHPSDLSVGSCSPSKIQFDSLLLYHHKQRDIMYLTSPKLIRSAWNYPLVQSGNNCVSIQVANAHALLEQSQKLCEDEYGEVFLSNYNNVSFPLLAQPTSSGFLLYTDMGNTGSWTNDDCVDFSKQYELLLKGVECLK